MCFGAMSSSVFSSNDIEYHATDSSDSVHAAVFASAFASLALLV